jgi:hypothetical protein
MDKHINIVAALQIGLSIFNLLIVLLFYTIMNVIGGFIDDPNGGMVLSLIANIISVALIVISIPGILAGLGLYKRQEWARILTLVISIIQLFSFPFGTAIGIYSIWALVQPETVAAFNAPKS